MFKRRSSEAVNAASEEASTADAEAAGSSSGLTRKPTKKKGVMRRVFSFKRTTSTTEFKVQRPSSDDTVDRLPTFAIGQTTDLGFNHPENEDRCNVIENLFKQFQPNADTPYEGTEEQTVSVFNVFDGHGGKTCSQWACEQLPQELSNLLWKGNYKHMIGPALHHSFKAVENKWCDHAKPINDTAGSCATSVIIKGTQIYCGNAGDSKALVFQQDPRNSNKAIGVTELNERHGAHLKSERKRILAAGGKISSDGAIYGVLYPSRGFGDIDVKSDGKPVVICNPNGAGMDEWKPYQLDTSKTTWMVLASDGLWDFASDNTVTGIVLKHQDSPLESVCKRLEREARMGGSEDDVTIVVVKITFPESGQLETLRE